MTLYEPVLRHPLDKLFRPSARRGRGRPRKVVPMRRRGIPFLAIRDGQCRYPLWGNTVTSPESLMFCGAATDGAAPYCPDCRARCWRGEGSEVSP